MEEKNEPQLAVDNSVVESVPVETVTESNDDKGLSLRDSLSVAVTAAEDKSSNQPIKGTRENPIREKIEEPQRLEAPATWSDKEKQDFYQSSRAQQEAVLRLEKSRNSRLAELKNAAEEAKAAKKEYEYVKKIAESINPLLKVHGINRPPEEVMEKAALLWSEFENAKDPLQQAANYLRAKGMEPPEGWDKRSPEEDIERKFLTLQEKQNQIEAKLAEREKAETEARQKAYSDYVSNAFLKFAESKNSSGSYKYPDLFHPELGPKVAAKVGSLVCGSTELSAMFLKEVRERIPNASDNQILEEALKFVGSKIDDTPAKTQPKQHLNRALRAASSVPGGSTLLDQSRQTKKTSLRDSLRMALEESREH